jgi:amino acid transporter
LVLVVMNFVGSGVQESFQRLLSLAVVLQLIPFAYIFGALLKIAYDREFQRGHYGRGTLIFAGISGLVTTTLGIVLAFFPAQQITSLASYEAWMIGGTLLFVGLAAFFFFVYGRRKQTGVVSAATGE